MSDPMREPDGYGNSVFLHLMQESCGHDFKGWREFDDGLGGETVCTKCGIGAMEHTLRTAE